MIFSQIKHYLRNLKRRKHKVLNVRHLTLSWDHRHRSHFGFIFLYVLHMEIILMHCFLISLPYLHSQHGSPQSPDSLVWLWRFSVIIPQTVFLVFSPPHILDILAHLHLGTFAPNLALLESPLHSSSSVKSFYPLRHCSSVTSSRKSFRAGWSHLGYLLIPLPLEPFDRHLTICFGLWGFHSLVVVLSQPVL